MKKIGIILAGTLLLGAAGYAAFMLPSSQDTIELAQRSAQTTNERLVAEGKVVPLQHAALSLLSGGIVATIRAAEGDRVAAGQPLLGLERACAGHGRSSGGQPGPSPGSI